jgi:thiosulfate/3-mercaptopyruvate sulfurtransferase
MADSTKNSVVILDVRSADEYKAGHIPNAINVPFGPNSAWSTSTDTSLLNLPKDADLFKTIGSCGITSNSLVVIVSGVAAAPNPPYPLADATRVADTLIYAGVKNVAIRRRLSDVGCEKEDNRYSSIVQLSLLWDYRQNMFVTREYDEKASAGLIIDCRIGRIFRALG